MYNPENKKQSDKIQIRFYLQSAIYLWQWIYEELSKFMIWQEFRVDWHIKQSILLQ